MSRTLACVGARVHAVVLFLRPPLSVHSVFKRRCIPTCPIACFEPSVALRVLQVHVCVDFIVSQAFLLSHAVRACCPFSPAPCMSNNTYAAIPEQLSADIVQLPAGKPESPPCSIIHYLFIISPLRTPQERAPFLFCAFCPSLGLALRLLQAPDGRSYR